MKKIILVAAFSFLFFACKSKSVTNTKLDNKTEVAMKGNWTISSVSYPGSDVIKVTSFDIADSNCFFGSTWKFVSNNNKGTMALNKFNCTAFSSNITWYVNQEGNFVLKILDESKARKVKEGYILRLSNLTDNSFQLIDRINIAGIMTDVVYQFNRN